MMYMTDNISATNLDQLVVRAFYWLDEGLQQNIRRRGGPSITHSQSLIIMSIGEGISRPSAIAERLGVSRQAIHQSLRELINVGIVELVPDPDDGRAKLARLSKTGVPIQLMALEILEDLEAKLGERIGKRRLKQLREALEIDWGEPVILD
jgi:DNA-binding MarR family transcriptional regulator